MDIIKKDLKEINNEKEEHIYNNNLYSYGMKNKIHSDDLVDSFNHYYKIKKGMSKKDINIKYRIYNYMEDYLTHIQLKDVLFFKLLSYIDFLITLLFSVVVLISTVYNYINNTGSDIILKATMILIIVKVLVREISKITMKKRTKSKTFTEEDRKNNLNIEGYLKRSNYNIDELILLLEKSNIGKYVLERLYVSASWKNNKSYQNIETIGKAISYLMIILVVQGLYFPNIIKPTPLYGLIVGLIITTKYFINITQRILNHKVKKEAQRAIYNKETEVM